MLTTSVTAGPAQALAHHKAILAAIDRGDEGAAEEAAWAHIARLTQALRER